MSVNGAPGVYCEYFQRKKTVMFWHNSSSTILHNNVDRKLTQISRCSLSWDVSLIGCQTPLINTHHGLDITNWSRQYQRSTVSHVKEGFTYFSSITMFELSEIQVSLVLLSVGLISERQIRNKCVRYLNEKWQLISPIYALFGAVHNMV